MKIRAKAAILLLTAAMTVIPALAGCTSSTGTASPAESSVNTEENVKYDYVVVLKASEDVTDDQRNDITTALDKRVTAYGIEKHVVTADGNEFTVSYNRSGDEDPTETANKLIKKGYVVFRSGNEADGEVLLDSTDISTAESYLDESTGTKQYVVKIIFKDESKDKLKDATEKNLNNIMSIWLDDQLISSPVVNDVISDGELIMFSGAPYTEEEAGKLAGNISCVMPLELTVVSAEKSE